ncbi:MAG: FGGY-family carbohydrate kinase [Spirochaetaceae bacterium]|jgi:xylulokinase|nr:FGGY-family carbohydrate kinase [Spirochaetaceae bacterium]
MKKHHLIAYDIGTTGNKACLYAFAEGQLELLAQSTARNELTIIDGGGAEQSPEEWWRNMCDTTKIILKTAGLAGSDIEAISFCSQMQGVVLVDKAGAALRPAMSYMDARAEKQFRAFCEGAPNIAGVQAGKLLVSLAETGVVAGSAKDPVFKYAWVRENEPGLFEKVDTWFDVKDYLAFRACGVKAMTEDSAFATMVYNPAKKDWSKPVCRLHGVNLQHLPKIVRPQDVLGNLSTRAADELGLSTNCKVVAGGGDSTLIGVGAGTVKPGDTHMYIGTSGWVITVTERRMVDVGARIATTIAAMDGAYNYFAEMETAGKCFEWAKEQIAPQGMDIGEICAWAGEADPGCNGLIFMPWLHGNRCPFEDAIAGGGFFNLGLRSDKREMFRAVIEGVAMHLAWMLEKEAAKTATAGTIRLVGGGARSPSVCQILADITGRKIAVAKEPHNAGALGAAILISASLQFIPSIQDAAKLVPIEKIYEPDKSLEKIYKKNYTVFKRMYYSNKQNFHLLRE